MDPTNKDLEDMQREMEAHAARIKVPPCMECGAETREEAETKCRVSSYSDHCHGCDLWP